MELSSAERDLLREELSSYLSEYRDKRDSEGEQLVHFPENFDVVADSMNRSDLTSEEEKPWSKYLLSSDGAKMEDALDVDGRYRHVLVEESAADAKYEKGIAQIQMYDKQLLSISRKAAQLKAQTLALGNDGLQDNANDDAMSTGRRSERSNKSLFFLTGKGRSEKSANTPRSESGFSAMDDSPQQYPASPNQHQDLDHLSSPEDKYSPSSSTYAANASRATSAAKSSASSSSSTKRRNLIQENILAVKSNPHNSLSSDEEHRLQTLLDIDESGLAWSVLSKYGFNDSQLGQLAELDQQLRQFRPTSAGGDDGPSEVPALADGNEKEEEEEEENEDNFGGEGGDYLTRQRLARQQSEYSSRLDGMLRSFSMEKADLTGLVGNDYQASRSRGSVSRAELSQVSRQLSTLSLPNPSCVDARHAVTMKEVEEIISAAKSEFYDYAAERVQDQDRDKDTESQHSHASQLLAPRHDIDRLLGSLRFEVQRLASLREKMLRGESAGSLGGSPQSRPGSSGDLHAGSNWHHLSPSGSMRELEDRLAQVQDIESDILMRFGVSTPGQGQGHQVKAEEKPRQHQQKQQQRQQQQQFISLSSFRLPQEDARPFLPTIQSGLFAGQNQNHASVPSQAQAVAGGTSFSSLPLIADSFRKKVQQLRSTRGMIEGDVDAADESERENFSQAPPPPPRPSSAGQSDKRKILI